MKRLLLLLPSNSYRASAFLAACREIEARVVIGVDEAQASTHFGDSRVVQFVRGEAGARLMEMRSEAPVADF